MVGVALFMRPPARPLVRHGEGGGLVTVQESLPRKARPSTSHRPAAVPSRTPLHSSTQCPYRKEPSCPPLLAPASPHRHCGWQPGGPLTLSGGLPSPRDYTGDNIGDLLALASAGRLDIRPGTGHGTVGAAADAGYGWLSTSRLIPISGLDSRHGNDLRVRDASGRLFPYDGFPGQPFNPTGSAIPTARSATAGTPTAPSPHSET